MRTQGANWSERRKWRGPERKGQDLSQHSQFHHHHQQQQQQVKILFHKMFVNSFLLPQLQSCTLLARCFFPDTVHAQNLETVDLLFANYLPQICIQKKTTNLLEGTNRVCKPGRAAHHWQEAESLITFRVQTVAAGLVAHCIKSSLCSLHAINQTM